MIVLVLLTPLLFLGFWMAASYMMQAEGWDDLMRKYKYKEVFSGERIGLVSTIINESKYKKSFALSFNKEGFYLKPVFLLLFHQPVYIPWQDAKVVAEKNIGTTRCVLLNIGNPLVATIALNKSVYEKMKTDSGWIENYNQQSETAG